MDDAIWLCNAPMHISDLASAANEDDSEQADDYFFSRMNDDTVYYEPVEGEEALSTEDTWVQEVPAVQEEEQYPVNRRRSRSVGSRPLFLRKPEASSHQQPRGRRPGPVVAVHQAKPAQSIDDPDTHFIDGLRAYQPNKKAYEAPKCTKPAPFNLTESKKKTAQSGQVQPSMAEGLQRWEKKTPERFHSTRHGEVYRVVEKFELRTATEAHTPQLSAVKRHRPVHALSREALEAQEVEEMKKNQFKAHGIDDKVFKAPHLPPKKETKPTKIEPFHLSETHKKENIAPEEVEYHFHAKPAPKLQPPAMEPRQPAPVTVPQTPKFSAAGKASIYSWRRQRSRSNGSLATSNRSGSSSNGSLTSSNTNGPERAKNTVAAPFSFEIRDKMLQQRREMKIKKVIEQERKQREFHATPCPTFSMPSVPERSTIIATKAVPFKLSCETIGKTKLAKFTQQMKEMELNERKATEFKAQPAKVLKKEPFKVNLDQTRSLPITEVVEFQLSTAKRPTERKAFEEHLKRVEVEKEAARLQREEERLRKEEEEAARLRESATFVANPIRQFKPLEIKKADVEVTVPQTPKFMKK